MAKNFVSNKDETVVMFKNPLLEVFTRIHWSVPLFLYGPVVLYFLYKAAFVIHLPFLLILGLFVGGVVTWSFAEYIIHRWVFHTELPGEIGKRIHFVAHGVHHDYPHDSKRLVMVPSISLPLAFVFYFVFYYAAGEHYMAPLFAGFVVGYLFYDTTHYAIHHYNFKSKFWLSIKQHHMLHHYQDSHKGYGVSSSVWDHVFRTTFNRMKRSESSAVNETEQSA
jgi:sterol desaturase/sphingolipid hydroxylase (fatty acid hydroxylase superfamily)